MSETNETPPAANSETPPANTPPANTPPAETPPSPQTPPAADDNSQRQHASNREVIAAVESLPEKIVNSIREALVPASAPPANSGPPANTDKDADSGATPGKNSGTLGERFNKFWWGTK